MTHADTSINLISTLQGSLLDKFFPAGWDLARIDQCCSNPPASILDRQPWWHPEFQPIPCGTVSDLDTVMGHEIALRIRRAREAGKRLAMILPVGPMGMYRWTVFFLKEWGIPCDHVHGFNMDEWSDADGNTPPPDNTSTFQFAMEHAFYGPLGELSVPESQRHFPTRDVLPSYADRIGNLTASGAELIVVYGIGRICHIAFWEPQLGAEFPSDKEWKQQTHRLAVKLHPLTIEQSAMLKFKSRITRVPTRANSIGPGLFLRADWTIGAANGVLCRGFQWQGMTLWITLRYGPDRSVPSSYMPTLPGRLFFVQDLTGPLE